MKPLIRRAAFLAAIAASSLLAGCAATRDQHQSHHPGGMMRQGGMMGQGGRMDMQAMCDMHRRMMDARSPQEREAMMDEHMRNMTPEMRQRHMEMLRQQCR